MLWVAVAEAAADEAAVVISFDFFIVVAAADETLKFKDIPEVCCLFRFFLLFFFGLCVLTSAEAVVSKVDAVGTLLWVLWE